MEAQPHEDPASRLNASGFTLDIDRDAFSVELTRLVGEALREAGIDDQGGLIIRLQVVYLDFLFQGPCLLDYTVALGAAPPFGLQSRGDSSNFVIACRSALELAVSDVLNDPRTAAYLRAD